MSYRQHVLKPSVALWAMTGVLLLYSLGIVVVLLTLSAVVIGFGAWWAMRQHHPHPVAVGRARPRRQPNVINR
ncbi:hypothetical protein ACTMTJ_31200 [Phytohabitans sp. LJ34]|uniref:hypothetical protein n=1 Tax=Phytohabitans sp. LJ34 TaxID=3452217 RepID=UPI003F8A9C51